MLRLHHESGFARGTKTGRLKHTILAQEDWPLIYFWQGIEVKCTQCGKGLEYYEGSARDHCDPDKLCPECLAARLADKTIERFRRALKGCLHDVNK